MSRWVSVLNRFDEILEKYSKFFPQSFKEKKPTSKMTSLVKGILAFVLNLIKNNRDDGIYTPVEHLVVLVHSEDPEIVLLSLEIYYFLLKKETRNPKIDTLFNQKLLVLANGYGTNTFEKVLVKEMDEKTISKGSCFSFESITEKKKEKKVQVIQVKDLHLLKTNSSDFFIQILEKHNIIDTKLFSIWHMTRLAFSFHSYNERVVWTKIRLIALACSSKFLKI